MKIGHIFIDESELHFSFVRASGPGGQNVNKVATAVLLRYDITHSTLPEPIRKRLLVIAGNQISSRGELVIKAGRYRTQLQNKKDAQNRLKILIQKAALVPKSRRPTKISLATKERRLQQKKLTSKIKAVRAHKINIDE